MALLQNRPGLNQPTPMSDMSPNAPDNFNRGFAMPQQQQQRQGSPNGMKGGGGQKGMPQGMPQGKGIPGMPQAGGMGKGGGMPQMMQVNMGKGGGMPQMMKGGMSPSGVGPTMGGRTMPVLPGGMMGQPMGQMVTGPMGEKGAGGMQAGVQYMPCIIPVNQTGSLPMGAVAIGQLSPDQLPNAAMHISQMTANQNPQATIIGGPGANQQGPPQQQGARPARGRSPQQQRSAGFPPQQGPPFQQWPPSQQQGGPNFQQPQQQGAPGTERDWGTVRDLGPGGEDRQNQSEAEQGYQPKHDPFGNAGAAQDKPTQDYGAAREKPGQVPQEPQPPPQAFPRADSTDGKWRPSGQEPWRQPERQASARRNSSGSPDRRTANTGAAERNSSAERRPALERRTSGERKVSAERTTSAERRGSPERATIGAGQIGAGPREARTMGSMRLQCDFELESQESQWWQHTLPSGQQAQVFFVADPAALSQAVSRLGFQGPRSLTAVDLQGVNLRAAAGRLCVLQVAFWDGGGLQCFLFDIMQLGEHVNALSTFLQSIQAPKFMYNASLAATVLAHKFGISLAGVIDVQSAFKMLENQSTISCLIDYFDWCNISKPGQREEWSKMDKNPELWAHRPLARPTLSYAVQGICSLHSTYPFLSSKLCGMYGPSALEMLANVTQQLVTVQTSAGWACRNAGLWIGEQGPSQQDDPDMDDWLAKRFGKSKTQTARSKSPERAIRALKAELPVSAVRA